MSVEYMRIVVADMPIRQLNVFLYQRWIHYMSRAAACASTNADFCVHGYFSDTDLGRLWRDTRQVIEQRPPAVGPRLVDVGLQRPDGRRRHP